jgi:hypothetical protein
MLLLLMFIVGTSKQWLTVFVIPNALQKSVRKQWYLKTSISNSLERVQPGSYFVSEISANDDAKMLINWYTRNDVCIGCLRCTSRGGVHDRLQPQLICPGLIRSGEDPFVEIIVQGRVGRMRACESAL